MQLVEDDAGDVEPVLGVRLGGQDLVDGIGRGIDQAFLGGEDLHPPGQWWACPHHVGGDLEHDGGLLAVDHAPVDFGALLTVRAGQYQGDRGRKLAFPCFLGIST